ncbi:uncharacterized protein MYCFIDRAFT_171232 [Pseudocercospora fijiensis CIRAD86]|uniref:Uncharacterized protein n=1 Tax=Pseudocercospora fijiensis (strain CIRAD86) TaxID=383855 RepID=M3A297_PSEFD|nr:uncharacterized protein MYCFIDRAFT_171232 [Pseudocercospora fijiensis CIRAD86]EME85294.1 hypothetical protein MYCFIDRAFT_171232 [Pseudocercospora fijiensis CIRAD86]
MNRNNHIIQNQRNGKSKKACLLILPSIQSKSTQEWDIWFFGRFNCWRLFGDALR